MRYFGEPLRDWLDFLTLRQEDFADLCELNVSYIRNVMRGDKPGGIRIPGRRNRDKMLTALERAWGQPMTIDRFWEGAPRTTLPPPATPAPTTVALDRVIESDEPLYWKGRLLSAREQAAARTAMRTVLELLHPTR